MCNWATTLAAKDAVDCFAAAAHTGPALCWAGDLEFGFGDDRYEGCRMEELATKYEAKGA